MTNSHLPLKLGVYNYDKDVLFNYIQFYINKRDHLSDKQFKSKLYNYTN